MDNDFSGGLDSLSSYTSQSAAPTSVPSSNSNPKNSLPWYHADKDLMHAAGQQAGGSDGDFWHRHKDALNFSKGAGHFLAHGAALGVGLATGSGEAAAATDVGLNMLASGWDSIVDSHLNSPEEQMNQMTEAGVNPNLAIGSIKPYYYDSSALQAQSAAATGAYYDYLDRHSENVKKRNEARLSEEELFAKKLANQLAEATNPSEIEKAKANADAAVEELKQKKFVTEHQAEVLKQVTEKQAQAAYQNMITNKYNAQTNRMNVKAKTKVENDIYKAGQGLLKKAEKTYNNYTKKKSETKARRAAVDRDIRNNPNLRLTP